jgi:phosphopantetheinyl transferase
MISIYVTDTLAEMPGEKWWKIQRFFNGKILERLEKSPCDSYRLKRFTSRLMLIQIFEDLGIPLDHLGSLCYNAYGKLVVKHIAYNVSISYSNRKTVCLVSDDKIGIDLEDTSIIPAQRQVNLLEQLTATIIKDRLDFYYIWTKMESIAKIYEDKGLAEILYDPGAKERHYTHQHFIDNDYLLSLSSAKAFDIVAPVKPITV